MSRYTWQWCFPVLLMAGAGLPLGAQQLPGPGAEAAAYALPGDLTVNFNDARQRIDGFGAADVWIPTAVMTDQIMDLFYTPSPGIGLTILRVGIDTTGKYIDQNYATATKAAARGAIVWGAPWSPPGEWKTNGTSTNGGHLLASQYDAWATVLASFAADLQTNAGVPLYGISAQNEPDYTASYDTALYTNLEMTAFIKALGPKLAQLTPKPKLIIPEVADWSSLWKYTSSVLQDPTAAAYVDVFATHQYATVSAPQTSAKPIWMTEMSGMDSYNSGMGNGVTVAKWIHDALTTGGANAWHYWFLIGENTDNEGLLGYDVASSTLLMTKRFYTMGNFSRFVRPGFVRIGSSGGPSGVYASAYKDPATGSLAIVAINTNGGNTSFAASLTGTAPPAVTPWVTSSSENLARHADLTVSSGRFTTTLPGSSVTTFVVLPNLLPPTTPANLTATPYSSTQVNLSWTASTDPDSSVAGYRIFRDGVQVGDTTTTTFSDTGLQPSMSYAYAVLAYDSASHLSALSDPVTATTPAPDVTPPTVSITAPQDGANVTGTITVTAAAADDNAISKVQFYLDGTVKAVDGTAPYTWSWNTAQTSAGAHTVMAVASDLENNTASATVSVINLSGTTAPKITAFTSTPSNIATGASATLAWTVSGSPAPTLSIDNGVGTVTGTSRSVTPSQTTTYILTASNLAGTVTASVTVTVIPPAPPSIVSFAASPATITAGQSTTLSWSTSGSPAPSLTLNGAAVTGTSKVVTPSATTTYTLAATNSEGSASQALTVTVNPVYVASDVKVYKDNTTAGTSIVSPSVSTASTNELLLAFVSAGAGSSGMTVRSVTGGSLTWTLVKRTNSQGGTTEVWRAFATAKLSRATVTASLSQSSTASLTVMSFSGVSSATPIGATVSAGAATGAPSAVLITTRNNSWVVGVGNDLTGAVARTPGDGQTLVHQMLATNKSTYWVQMRTAPIAQAGTAVTIDDTAPVANKWNVTAVELLPQ